MTTTITITNTIITTTTVTTQRETAVHGAMQRFETALQNRQGPVQLLLPAIEIAAAMREGVGELMRRAGLELISLLMEQELEELVGQRHRP